MPRSFLLPESSVLALCSNQDMVFHAADGAVLGRMKGLFADELRAALTLATFAHESLEQTLENLNPATRWAITESGVDWIFRGRSLFATRASALEVLGFDMLFVELTDQCNERCTHCYAESSPERNIFLPKEIALRAMIQAKDLGFRRVQFTGGDPLLHPDLVELVDAATELQFEIVEIYTNGLALGEGLISKFRASAPSFAFSYYSHIEETHDSITRVPGSHRRTLKAIERAKEAGFAVRVSMVLLEENAHHHADAQRDLAARGIAQLAVSSVHQVGRGSEGHSMQALPLQSVVESGAVESAASKSTSSHENIPLSLGKLRIAPDGNVSPCVFNRDRILGSLHHSTLREIVFAPPSKTLASKTLASKTLASKTLADEKKRLNVICEPERNQRLECQSCRLTETLLQSVDA